MSPFFVCACSDQFIIFWFGGFILSIFGFLPQLSPPSGSKREEKKSAKHQAPGGSQVLHCQKKKKKILRWKTSEKGAPQRGLVQAGRQQNSESLRIQLSPVACAAASTGTLLQQLAGAGTQQGGGCGAVAQEGISSPPAPHRASRSLLLAPLLSPLSAPSLLPLPGVPSSPGFQMSHRSLTPSPRFSTPANEV